MEVRYPRRTEAEGSPVEGLCVVEGVRRNEDIDVRDSGDHLVFGASGFVKAMMMAMAMVEGERWRRGSYLFVPRSGRGSRHRRLCRKLFPAHSHKHAIPL